ncbi:reverse transcriptase domain-containing protein [Tanacetum coccineum]
MRTRNSNFPNNSPVTIPRRRNRGCAPNIVEPELRTIVEVAPMAERTMEELLRAPTEGYGEAIVIPKINADHFEIKTNLLQLVQASTFHGFERDNPHTHINNFKRITLTLKFRDVPNDVIKLMMFPYSLEGSAWIWYEKEPPNSILTWEDLVTKFVNQFLPPSKTTHLKNEISRLPKNSMRPLVKHGNDLSKCLELVPTTDLRSGNLLSKTTIEALNIIENKSKVRYSHNKSNVSRMNTTSRESVSKMDERIDKLADQISTLVEIVSKKVVTLAPVKAVEESCVTCGGAHAYYNCPNTDNNQSSVCAATGTYNQVFPPNRVSNYMAPPGFAPMQNNGQNRSILKSVLGFSNNSSGGNPTTTFEPIISDSFLSFTPFEESDFILEEIEAFLKDDSISPKIDHVDCDPEGDICLIEKMLNNDPFQLPPMDLKEVTKAKPSIEEPLELELKDLPSHLEYAYLEKNDKLPVIIAKSLKDDEKEAFLKVLKSHKRAIAWKITDIKGIDPRFCTHKILMQEDYKPTVQSQRRVNPKIHEVIKKEVIKLLDPGMIYPIFDSPWVSPIHCVPKKGGITVVANEENELLPTRLVTWWRVCIDYRNLNEVTRKDHFPLPFLDQMLERLAGNEFYCFLDRFSRYFQIPIDPQDQEKTTFTCPYGTFAYRRMPFGLCNAPGTFQRCMMAIFHDMIEKTMEVFMDDFSVFGDSFATCLSNLDNMLKQCEDTNLVLNWEKSHFMCKEGIVLGHKISKSGIEVDRAKVDVIAKLPHLTTIKGETPCVFSKDCIDAFEKLKKKPTEALILVVPDWNLHFKLMCDASDFAIEKEMLVVVYAFEKFRPYLVVSKSIVYTDHSALKYLLSKQDAKLRLLAIISDRGTHFYNDQFAKVMSKYGVTHHLATAYHPQMSGQVEVSNRGLKRILERTVGENHASWSDRLDDTLWAFRTAYKTPIGCTPYKLVYGKSCHLLIELEHKAYWALKHANFDLKTAGDHQKLQLNELRDQAYENSFIYKERTKKLHDSKIKDRIFNVGDRVLLFNSHLKIFSGKLKTRWSGPFTITQVFPYGTIELSQPDCPNFKVNSHRVKHYFGGDIPSKVVPDLQTFSK